LRKIGLHVRLTSSFSDLLRVAVSLHMPIFQCFFITKAGSVIELSDEEIASARAFMQDHFSFRYVHASYWSNLAGIKQSRHRVLMKELDLARRLEFTHIIMHAGSAKGARDRREGIDALAKAVNGLIKEDDALKIVLENTAYHDMSIGGSFKDFYELLQKSG